MEDAIATFSTYAFTHILITGMVEGSNQPPLWEGHDPHNDNSQAADCLYFLAAN
jgi:hypothetical protein